MKFQKDPGQRKIAQTLYLNLLSEIRDNKEEFSKIYNFLYSFLPQRIKDTEFLHIKSYNRKEILGTFRINTFMKSKTASYFRNFRELLQNLELDEMKKLLKIKNIELIGIDESKVEVPLEGSTFTYLKSTAFRMFNKDGIKAELVGPLTQKIKLNYRDTEYSDKEIQFLEYIRNLYVILLAIKNSIKNGHKPIVFVHGPLVRAIGGFTDLHFEFEQLKDVLSIDTESQEGIDPEILQLLDGESLLKELHEFEKNAFKEETYRIKNELLKNERKASKWKDSIPWKVKGSGDNLGMGHEKDFRRRTYSALSIYLYLLRKLFTLSKNEEVLIISVVEDISKASEISKYILPNMFFNKQDSFEQLLSKGLTLLFKSRFGLNFPSEKFPDFNEQLYKYCFNLSKKISIFDTILMTQTLNEADYTNPIPTFRYLTKNFYEEKFGFSGYGIENNYQVILDIFFSFS